MTFQIRFHDTAAGRVVPFRPLGGGPVRIYACGPTVHAEPHVGNARAAVVADLWRDVLEAVHGPARLVRNVTDVDDKIIARARAEGVGPEEVARRSLAQWHAAMRLLRVRPPDVEPRATEHIPDMVEMAARLVASGHAYALSDGHVLFRAGRGVGLGFLRGQRAGFRGGHRRVVRADKEAEGDFVLWKPVPADEPGWDSPWGRGRPGWHIECSAMAARHLGEVMDIHMGGADLKAPHHENEMSQSCAAHGTDALARHWLHVGLLRGAGGKMSKSLGNVRTVPEEAGDDPERGAALRLALLSARWRSPLSWDAGSVDRALSRLRRWRDRADLPSASAIPPPVLARLASDADTPGLFADMDAWSRAGGQERLLLGHALRFLRLDGGPAAPPEPPPEAVALLRGRDEMRERRDWAGADAARGRLAAMGWEVRDGREGSRLVPRPS